MQTYIIVAMLLISMYYGISILKRSFLICNTEKFIKIQQDKLDYFTKTSQNKSLIGWAFLFGLFYSLTIILSSIYAISAFIGVK